MKFTLALLFVVVSMHMGGAFARYCPKYKFKVVTATSHNAYGLTSAVEKFQKLLGGENNVDALGPLKEGFRAINWDGAGVPFDMPFDFFNTDVPRGALFFAKGQKFAVSNPAKPPPKDDRFSSLNKAASRDFITFSPKRLFTPVKDNKLVQKFVIPGDKKRASVSGYGAVFVDVDKKDTTFMKFTDKHGCPIATIYIPPKSKGLSFVGIKVFKKIVRGRAFSVKAPIAKVAFKLGNKAIVKKYGYKYNKYANDVVVLDDLFYGEPQKF